jgi:hypothetical protein
LRTGQIRYNPQSSQVSFRLDLYSEGPTATGLVQVVTSARTANPSAPLYQGKDEEKDQEKDKKKDEEKADDPVPLSTHEQTFDRVVAKRSGSPGLKPVASTHNPPRLPASTISTQAAALSTTVAAASPKEISSPTIPAFNGVDVAPSLLKDSARLTLEMPRPEPSIRPEAATSPSGRDLSVRVSAEPVTGSRLGHLVSKIPALRSFRQQVKAVPPVPILRPQPTVKIPEKDALTRPVSVEVKVYVGESGTVKHAEVTDYGDPPNWNLANASLATAKLWTFEPARIEDIAVSSEVLLHFRFSQ